MRIDTMNVTLYALTIQNCGPVGAVRIARGKVDVITSVLHENTGENGGAFFLGAGTHLTVSNRYLKKKKDFRNQKKSQTQQ